MRVIQVMDGYQYLHVPNLGGHGNILLNYGVLFDSLTMSLAQLRVMYICMFASATAHLFMLIYSLPLVHRPKAASYWYVI